jgi:ubiquinone/menaquinone biosynthesis C-methylase UbiE
MAINHTLREKEKQPLIEYTEFEGKHVIVQYAQFKLLVHLQEQGLFTKKDAHFSLTSLKETFNFLEKYTILFHEIISILHENGYIILKENSVTTTEKVESAQHDFKTLTAKIETGIYSTKSSQLIIQPFIKLMNTTIPLLVRVGRGELGYLNALFPSGDKTLVEGIYKTSVGILYNETIAGYCEQITAELKDSKKTLRILEIGAGTGGTTIPMLEMLKANGVDCSYTFTDISRGMLRYGKRIFDETYDFMEYKTLNIDNDPIAQGFEAHSFDLILCSNVLHATLNINETLANTKKLLAKTNGYLIINEIIEKLDFNTITFGLTDGWWKYTDVENRIAHSPVLTQEAWNTLLTEINLTEIVPSEHTKHIYREVSQGIFMYKS